MATVEYDLDTSGGLMEVCGESVKVLTVVIYSFCACGHDQGMKTVMAAIRCAIHLLS
jgi:hypothetical protein